MNEPTLCPTCIVIHHGKGFELGSEPKDYVAGEIKLATCSVHVMYTELMDFGLADRILRRVYKAEQDTE